MILVYVYFYIISKKCDLLLPHLPPAIDPMQISTLSR